MNTRILLASFATAAIALVSCSKNEIYQPETEGAPISFSTYLPQTPVMKGKVTDNSVIQVETNGFGVNAAYTGKTVYGSATGDQDPDYMYNQQVTYKSGTWSYSPMKYWPKEDNENVSFFAYAPYNGKGIELCGAASSATADKLTFTVQENPSETVDFVASGLKDAKNSQGPVQFKLMHELTRVNFEAVASADLNSGEDKKTTVVISSIRLKGKNASTLGKTAVYTYAGTIGTAGSWGTPTAYFTDAYNLGADENFINSAAVSLSGFNNGGKSGVSVTSTTAVPLLKTGEYLFLLPQNGTAGMTTAGDVKVELDYVVVTEDSKLEKKYVVMPESGVYTKTLDLPVNTLAQGKAYKFTFKFTLAEVSLSAIEIESGWGTEADTELGV